MESLYGRQVPSMIRLAYLLTGDEHGAQDIVHEAFVKIGRKLFGLRSQEHEAAYLYRTVVNLCRGRARRLRTEQLALERVRKESRDTDGPSGRDPIWEALLVLPVRQRAALYLRYHQDLSEAQTAEVLDCSVSAVKSLVNRGLKELRLRTEGSEL